MDVIDYNVGEVVCGYCGEYVPVFVLAQHYLEMVQRGRLVRGRADCSVCRRQWEVDVACAETGATQLGLLAELNK